MSDVRKLEEKLNDLESKLRVTFEALEKRLNELASSHADNSESRFQELEDLILLLQIEQMKIVEKISYSANFGLSESSPKEDYSENNLKIAEMDKTIHELSEKITSLESRNVLKRDAVISPDLEYKSHALERLQKILAG